MSPTGAPCLSHGGRPGQMLHVLRHYLPFRKALLIACETVLLTLVVGFGMSSHLLWVEVHGSTLRL
ncbi:MAG: hypothetical protein WD226_14220, partial [Planctomycetota bacterium]